MTGVPTGRLVGRMILDLVLITLKLLTALYAGSLLLAADALYGLFAWFRLLSQGGGAESAVPRALVIPTGLVLAAGVTGLAWQGVGDFLARFQGLAAGGPGLAAPLAAVFALAVRYTAGRTLFSGEDLYFEGQISHWTAALLLPAALFPALCGILDPVLGVILCLFIVARTVRVIYVAAEGLFSSAES